MLQNSAQNPPIKRKNCRLQQLEIEILTSCTDIADIVKYYSYVNLLVFVNHV